VLRDIGIAKIRNELREEKWISTHQGNGCMPQALQINTDAYPVDSENFIERNNEKCMTRGDQWANNDVPPMPRHDEDDDFDAGNANEITLQVDNEDIVPAHVMLDYCHRSRHKLFEELSLREHAEWVFKITKKSEAGHAGTSSLKGLKSPKTRNQPNEVILAGLIIPITRPI
jgi:hypothetical protein